LLSGVVLLGAVAKFNEMPPDAQASLLGGATEIARSWLQSAIAAYDDMTAAAVVESSGPGPPDRPPGADSQKAAGAPPLLTGPNGADRAADASGNPLWALPLAQLSTTRERPIFSPSRRLPPPAPAYVTPVAIQQPAKPPEAERPTVSLIGTIIGTGNDRLGVFVDTSTQGTLRLRIGEDYHGWVARLINPREAILVKDGEPAVVLELPPPGGASSPKRSGRDAVLDRVWKVGAD
jgi:general secretion pathway protein N